MKVFLERHAKLVRMWTAYMVVAILFAGFPLSALAQSSISADIKINGQDGIVTITNGTSWNYSWTSSGATACQINTPTGVSGITLAGNDGPIPSGHPWYPAVGGSTTLTFTCTDGTNTAIDSATVRVVADVTPPPPPPPRAVTADIKINGQDGIVTITNGTSWNYSWTSSGATACQINTPTGVSGITLAGNDGPIPSGHPWYPAVGGSTTLTFTCTDGTNTAIDSATVRVVADVTPPPPPPPRAVSASVSSGGVRSAAPAPVVVANFCPFLTSYMRIDFQNDPIQVIRLQAFLRAFEGHNIVITGVFDEATRQAVNAFQLKYAADVLHPWGITQPTGYVYIRTVAKINQIICGTALPPVSAKQVVPQQPSVDKEVGRIDKEGGIIGKEIGVSASTTSGIPIIGNISPTPPPPGSGLSNGQNTRNGVAAGLFASPQSFAELMQGLYQFLLVLIVLYIIGSVLENVLYKNIPENVRKKFYTKWGTILAGLVVALIGAFVLEQFVLILPLLVAALASATWMFLYPKHELIKTRSKTMWDESKQFTDSPGAKK